MVWKLKKKAHVKMKDEHKAHRRSMAIKAAIDLKEGKLRDGWEIVDAEKVDDGYGGYMVSIRDKKKNRTYMLSDRDLIKDNKKTEDKK